jgi:hypothetical protein
MVVFYDSAFIIHGKENIGMIENKNPIKISEVHLNWKSDPSAN